MAPNSTEIPRLVKQRAYLMLLERVYQDWQKAGRNIRKAAKVFHLFVDDLINPVDSFQSIQ